MLGVVVGALLSRIPRREQPRAPVDGRAGALSAAAHLGKEEGDDDEPD